MSVTADYVKEIRSGLPSFHQLGPQCFCASCNAHRAVSRLEAGMAELSSALDDLYTDVEMAESDGTASLPDRSSALRAGTVLAKWR
jgi:hypothetical protein